jgi:hypothetical protein
MNKINYLDVDVYRFPMGDCSNGGISSRFGELAVACPYGPHSFDADEVLPLNFCVIERRELGFTDHVRIVPATVDERGVIVKRPGWWMFGGNVARTSDSRFYELSGVHYALDIHDRQE